MSGCRRPKILFVVPSLRHGGAEVQAVNLVNGLEPDEFESHLLYYDRGEALRERVDCAKVHLHRLRKQSSFDVALVRDVARLIDQYRIELVHCTLQYSLLVAWTARLISRSKPKLVCALHTTINRNRYEEAADRLVYHWLLRACVGLIFVCHSQRAHWLRKYPELEAVSHVVFNGIDAARFDPARSPDAGAQLRSALGVPASAKVVSCVAAFRPEKGHHVLLKAFSRVAAKLPEAYLILAGDGPARPDAERRMCNLGLRDRVRFLGATDDVGSLLAATDVTVLASTAVETFSMAMLESMAMKVPLVATDMGGTREAVRHGETGLLVPPNDVVALSEGMIRLLSDDALRRKLGEKARDLVLADFTQELMIRDIQRILSSAVS